MKFENIKNIVRETPSEPIDINNRYSVLIPFIEVEGEPHLLYELRSKTLKSQPGEISFPGGSIEEGEGIIDAAVRETCEELLINPDKIEVYGEGNFLVNPYGSILYSVVGKLNVDIKDIKPSADEVEDVFTVPLKYFMEKSPESYEIEFKAQRDKYFPYELIPNGKNYKFKKSRDSVLFYQYGKFIIWGFTAKMTHNFVNKIKKNL
ncbi:MAG: CoA pyrophosphatase [Peptoniphilus sp.]|nr:CoA pyrophosphatase [Peptoniphilus sp.]